MLLWLPPLLILVTLPCAGLAWLAGRSYGIRTSVCSRFHFDALPPEPEPICGCGHSIAFHDQAGRCSEHSEKAIVVTFKTLWYPRCPCRQYVGPEPMPRMVTS